MKTARRFPLLLTLAMLWILPSLRMPDAGAATAVLDIGDLGMQEAMQAARTQLSDHGRLASLPSRHALIIEDDQPRIERVRKLFARISRVTATLAVDLDIGERERTDRVGAALAGGWRRMEITGNHAETNRRRHFHLLVMPGHVASIDLGSIDTADPRVLALLQAHGIRNTIDLDRLPDQAGLDIRLTLLEHDRVRLRIHPWLGSRSDASDMQAAGKIEILPALGNTRQPNRPPAARADMRLNLQPGPARRSTRVDIAEADTVIEARIGVPIVLAASQGGAREFAWSLLAMHHVLSRRSLVMRLQVQRP